MPICFQCNWVINFPLKRERVGEILDAAFQWIYLKGAKPTLSKKRFSRIIRDYWREGELMLCRRCFLNSFLLFVPDKLRKEFKNDFIKYLL